MSWTQQQVEILIEGYRNNECLYAVKSQMYKNKHARTKALEDNLRNLKPVKPQVSIGDIKTKWNGIRTNFLSEWRKYKDSFKSGAGEDEVYKPTLFYYEKMQFILDYCVVRKSQDTIMDLQYQHDDSLELDLENLPIDFCESDINLTQKEGESQEIPDFSEHTKRKRTSKKTEENILEESTKTLKKIADSLTIIDKPDVQTNNVFGNYVESRLNLILDDETREEAEEEITSVLFRALKKYRVLNKNK